MEAESYTAVKLSILAWKPLRNRLLGDITRDTGDRLDRYDSGGKITSIRYSWDDQRNVPRLGIMCELNEKDDMGVSFSLLAWGNLFALRGELIVPSNFYGKKKLVVQATNLQTGDFVFVQPQIEPYVSFDDMAYISNKSLVQVWTCLGGNSSK